ncbi:aminotransferase class I/II-fold pyridoxal phosphate-dependent enzyme [Pseudarthrobacter enclensis]|uniref:Arginine/lysine/ornithine decarboxylase n=1 Tax=Pseudarthrobacter enclensis TaxID=993070 RepID=A0ABT9RPZ8_9MICC|nr:ornithine decarboxylase [Pseudarthrobacter enclensis]MDP9887308.1 arginine/lysine/ornithine decarboxylase [Pseudarthrobacter enclensis]
MDHNEAPLLDALDSYHKLDRYGFTPPGHRQGRGADPRVRNILGPDTFRADVLASAGLDDRSSSGGYLKKAEQLMADAVGADQAFFSTCGSSLSVKAAVIAVAAGKGDLLVSRDAHKSITAGLVFSGIQPRWIRPRWDPNLHIAHPPSPADVEEMWERYPDAAGALIVSPTPYGTCADIAAIAKICHDRGKPLIVDEAWGAHLPFHEGLPTWAMSAGADVCVVSVHKMGAGFEQGSVYHLQGDLVDAAHLSQCADLLMTTSPNAILYSAIDGWRRQMVQHGKELLSNALDLAKRLRSDIDGLPGIHVLEDELLAEESSHDLDLLQILMDLSGLGISGYQAADWLRENCRIDMGLSDHRRIMATMSMADDDASAERLLAALRALIDAAPSLPAPPEVSLPSPSDLELESVALPRDAFFGPREDVPAREAVGRIAAEQITPYPPGIPVVVPGERINEAIVEYLESGLKAGMVLPDPADPSLGTIRVVRE